jgi:galactokinase
MGERLNEAKAQYEATAKEHAIALRDLATAKAEFEEAEACAQEAYARRNKAYTDQGEAIGRMREATMALGKAFARMLDAEQLDTLGKLMSGASRSIREWDEAERLIRDLKAEKATP